MKVVICTPSRDEVKAGFCYALAALLLANCTSFSLLPLNSRGPEIAKVRNRLVTAALSLGADALLWIDSDIVLPASALARWSVYDKAIVGATYAMRSPLHADMNTPALAHEELDGYIGENDSQLRKVARLPGGAVLIRRDVYTSRVFEPWYESINDVPEDWKFCDKARAAGIDIFCDPMLSTQVVHLGEYPYATLPLLKGVD